MLALGRGVTDLGLKHTKGSCFVFLEFVGGLVKGGVARGFLNADTT